MQPYLFTDQFSNPDLGGWIGANERSRGGGINKYKQIKALTSTETLRQIQNVVIP